MRWAVPSSKVGSLESASAAAERESGVEGAGFASAFASDLTLGGVEAALAAPIGVAAAGFAEGATAEFWPNALPVENSRATATMATFRIFQSNNSAPGRRLKYRNARVRCANSIPLTANLRRTMTIKH